MSEWKKVSKDEFEAWIANYPRKFQVSVSPHGWFTMVHYYDWSIGKGEDARIAGVEFGEAPGEPNGEKPVKYSVRAGVISPA